MDGDIGEFKAGEKRNEKTPSMGVMSSTLVDLATELRKYAPLVAIVSVLGSYVYNTVFFHNIDGELYYQPFMSMLTLGDYVSTSFHFIPPIILIFLFAIFMVQAVALLLWRSDYLTKLFSGVVRWSQTIWLLGWVLGNPKRLGYLLSIILLLLPFGYVSITSETMQPRYNWGIAFIALTFLVLFFIRKDPKLSEQPQIRRLYVYAITTIAVVALSAVMGNYRFEMALNNSQKTLLSVGPAGSKFSGQKTLTGVRSLEKGVFFIHEERAGKPVAYFILYEGGFEFSKPIQPTRQGPVFQRIPCWLHLSICN